MNTVAWPSPVIVVVRSVPHIASSVSGMMVPSWLRGPRGEPTRVGASKLFLSHQPEHPSHRRAGPGITQSRPDLAMPLAMERTGGEYILDRRGQRVIRHRAERSAALPRRRHRSVAINARAGEPPHAADQGQAIWLAGDRRNGAAHDLRLRRTKGRSLSSRAIFSFSRSRSISAAPSLAFSRSLS